MITSSVTGYQTVVGDSSRVAFADRKLDERKRTTMSKQRRWSLLCVVVTKENARKNIEVVLFPVEGATSFCVKLDNRDVL